MSRHLANTFFFQQKILLHIQKVGFPSEGEGYLHFTVSNSKPHLPPKIRVLPDSGSDSSETL